MATSKANKKQVEIVKNLIKLDNTVKALKKLTALEYTDFFTVLIQDDGLKLYERLTSKDNLALLKLSQEQFDGIEKEQLKKKAVRNEKAKETMKKIREKQRKAPENKNN